VYFLETYLFIKFVQNFQPKNMKFDAFYLQRETSIYHVNFPLDGTEHSWQI